MKPLVKWCALAAFGLAASSAIAADHRDGSSKITDFGEADINDVYTFTTPDNSKLVLIQTIGGNPGVTSSSDTVQYVFHVARTDAPAILMSPAASEWTELVCEFNADVSEISCYLGTPGQPAIDWVIGDASSNQGLASASGDLLVHAGQHADPFYFYLQGFNATRATAIAAINGGIIDPTSDLEASGCVSEAVMNTQWLLATGGAFHGLQTVSQVLVGVLNGDNSADPLTCANVTACQGPQPDTGPGEFSTDQFAVNNVMAISVEVAVDAIPGTGNFYHVYASTHQKN